ncbi:NEAT domain-containing protein [Peptoniphilus sp. MSJ-1]|uniref:NEAT domain-containing protein n=1 Tax=Peptoniphilus ovalis TaxID=2841503 RepID=A0ABS6FHJ6_9FIRM|nr:NEAT domain-containing protein [Peptoniphilus ovalis]MBU5669446.1 NEAT domain-containing protein [Peptoniphilus ovalis]
MKQYKKIFAYILIIFSLFTVVFAKEKETPVEEEINLEDGFYRIPIKLWHAIDNKESMGNKALSQTAEIEVKDKEANLYIGSDKMEYMSIIASLVNVYFEKADGKYYQAEPGCFELEVPKENYKRPEVFRTSLINQNDFTKVYIDPKVEPMGDEPIRARIKLDFDKLEKIDEKDAKLIHKFKNGAKKKEFSKDESGEVQNKNLIINYDKDTFAEEFTFYGNKLSGEEADNYSKNFDKLDQVNVFKIEFLGPLKEISGNEESIQSTRKKIKTEKEFTLKIPLINFKKEDNLELYDMTGGEKKKLEFKINGEHLETRVKNPGVYLVVKTKDANAIPENTNAVNNSGANSVNNKASTKTERAKSFMTTAKKLKSKNVANSTSGNNSANSTLTSKVASTSAVNTSSESSLQKQMTFAKQGGQNTSGKSNIPNTNTEKAEDVEEIKERESAGIIFFIILIFITLNAVAIIFIKKNFKDIRDMKDEIIFLGGLKKNEK